MFANSPHASASAAPLSSLPAQAAQPPQAHVQQQPVIQHGQPQGMPPAAYGGPHGMHPGAAAPAPALGIQPIAARQSVGAAFITGAYQASGDPAIDRMVRLEAACKRFGSPF